MGIDSSFSHRTQIATLNGYSNYSGTATQNSFLLSKLKKGVLIRSVTRVRDTSAWEIDMTSSVSLRVGEAKTITIRFRGMGISSVGGSYTGSSYISASFANVNSRVGFIKQTTNACKSSSVAMALRLITGSNSYTSAGLGGGYCVGIGGNIYTGSDGNRYRAVYRQDTYRGSYNELIGEIDRSLSAGVPIVVPVHRTNGGTDHHWVVLVGKNGGDYLIMDSASGNSGTIMSGNTKTLSSAKYALDIANQGYAGRFYGYVSFSGI